MYRKDTDGWLKHWDFILLDMICLQLAFVLAYGLSGYGFNPYQTMLYRNMSIYIEVADLAVLFLLGTLRNDHCLSEYRDGSCVCPLSVPHTARADVFQTGYDFDICVVYSVGLHYQNPVEKIFAEQEKGSRKPFSAYCNH